MIIQFGLIDSDDYALYETNGKWIKIPCWLACEWDTANGGIYGLIVDYGLQQYQAQWEEPYALHRIQLEASALKRFFIYGDKDGLDEMHEVALKAERQVKSEKPFAETDFIYSSIAAVMNRHFHTDEFTIKRVHAILSEASDLLFYGEQAHVMEAASRVVKYIKKAA